MCFLQSPDSSFVAFTAPRLAGALQFLDLFYLFYHHFMKLRRTHDSKITHRLSCPPIYLLVVIRFKICLEKPIPPSDLAILA